MIDNFLTRLFSIGVSKKGIILDTKPLVLYVIGSLNQNRIRSFKKTKEFTVQEFTDLVNFLGNFERYYITPYILAEFSHHTIEQKSLDDSEKREIAKLILKWHKNGNLIEDFQPFDKVFKYNKISVVGSSDSSLLTVNLDSRIPILTSDGPFADIAIKSGRHAIKFIPTIGFANY